MTTIAFMQTSGTAALIANVLPIVVIVGIFWFLVIAPANKQRKKTEEMLAALKKGDEVITTGGIYGTIQNVENDVVHLRIADNVKIKISRAAVAGLAGGSK